MQINIISHRGGEERGGREKNVWKRDAGREDCLKWKRSLSARKLHKTARQLACLASALWYYKEPFPGNGSAALQHNASKSGVRKKARHVIREHRRSCHDSSWYEAKWLQFLVCRFPSHWVVESWSVLFSFFLKNLLLLHGTIISALIATKFGNWFFSSAWKMLEEVQIK